LKQYTKKSYECSELYTKWRVGIGMQKPLGRDVRGRCPCQTEKYPSDGIKDLSAINQVNA